MIDEKKLIEELQALATSREIIEYTSAYDTVQDCIGIVEKQPQADHSGEVTEMVTNADRIRNMTDEELAEFLEGDLICEESEDCVPSCKECRLRWLQVEVKEGNSNENT